MAASQAEKKIPSLSATDVPNAIPTHEQIAVVAYQFWLARGCPWGSPEVDWLKAEQSLSSTQAEFDCGKRGLF